MPEDLSQTRSGLSEREAAWRLKSEGYNELPRSPKRTLLRIVREIASEPMFELLLAAAAIYLVLGDLAEALMLGGSAIITVVIAVFQENRTERVLESLRDLTSPRALVIRDQIHRRIPGREVVRGDIIVLAEGDRVPADAILMSSNDLQADESLLTGESVPVRKTARRDFTSAARPGGDDLPFVFSGTMVVSGQGIGEVRATGPASEIGKIGKALSEITEEPTPLRVETRRLVRVLAAIGFALSVLTVVLYGSMRGSWLNGVLAGITLAMAILPEEFPLVLTIFLVMGAWRISRARVLTRRSATIETLGAATVLCTDKTGTLTLNQMSVAELRVGNEVLRVDQEPIEQPAGEFRRLIEFGILASEIEPLDPMEKAFHALGQQCLTHTEHHPDWVLAHEYGLTPELLAMSHVWKPTEKADYVVAAKGAPEAIADMCHLKPAALNEIRNAADQMAAQGMRVLGVAKASYQGPPWPEPQHEFAFEFLGLIGLADPLRPMVPNAVRECRSAGIRVAMITGDYPATAIAIAQQAGLDVAAGTLTGEELARMSDSELRQRVRTIAIFARIMPEQKLRIVNAFKANDEIVAMTGDGVNDAPSLKAAHIGIAMGSRGTDVAREAAAIVLLDDDFGSIVSAVRLGRRIYDNLRKAMGYLLAVHVPIAGLALLPLFFGWPLVFSPVHIAFLELIIDPVSSIVFEAEVEEGDLMRRLPRNSQRPLFSPALIAWSLIQGFLVFTVTATIYVGMLLRGMPEPQVRALTFASLVAGNFGLILVNRSFKSSVVAALMRPNVALWLIFGITVSLLGITLAIRPVRDLFRFGPLRGNDLMLVLAGGALTVLFLESIKAVSRSLRVSLA
jgi:P-type Ca2+ transporter type 2C